jgi:hypothetical protein
VSDPAAGGFIGLIRLDTSFPRPVGDVGNPNTFDFPVRSRVVPGASAVRVVRGDPAALLAPFVAAGRALAQAGAVAIGTSCGFLAPFQRELAAALPVPFAASALLQLAWLAPMLPAGRRAGVLTIDAASLGARHLEAAGAPADTPVAGLDPDGELATTIFGDRPRLDAGRARDEVLDAARRLLDAAPDLGAIVLECTNLPPYRDALMREIGLPVYDCNTLLRWLWAGAARPVPEESAR